MNRSNLLMDILKAEGLKIVDEEGFPAGSREENEEAWSKELDWQSHEVPDWVKDNEELGEYCLMKREQAQEMEKAWYEREARIQRRRRGKEVMVHRSRGNKYPNEVPDCSPSGERGWYDPAGGFHYDGDEDPASMYT
jgi:hypothetical protein